MHSKSRCDVVVHAEFRSSDPTPPPSATTILPAGNREEGPWTRRSPLTPPPGPPPLLATVPASGRRDQQTCSEASRT